MMTFTLPWSALAQDNHRLTTNRRTGQTFTTKRYRTAKAEAEALLLQQNSLRAAHLTPVSLVAHVWVPDARRRDIGNLRKLVTDALQNADVVADDCLIHDERWIRAGIDRTNPRMVVTIAPLTGGVR